MYTYEEIREALGAFLRMGYGDFSGEDYIDSLAEASKSLNEDDKSMELFTKLFEDNSMVHKLNVVVNREGEF